MSVVIHVRAAQDIVELTDRIRTDRPNTAVKFTKRLQRAIALLERSPSAGAELGMAIGGVRIRFMAITGFRNYLILHAPMPDGIVVIRVVDGRRNLKATLKDSG